MKRKGDLCVDALKEAIFNHRDPKNLKLKKNKSLPIKVRSFNPIVILLRDSTYKTDGHDDLRFNEESKNESKSRKQQKARIELEGREIDRNTAKGQGLLAEKT